MVIGPIKKGIAYPQKCWECQRAVEFTNSGGKACDHGRSGRVKTVTKKDIACSAFLK